MKIKRLAAENFGKFDRFAVNLDKQITIFYGANEAGKTTLFDMITSLLFAPHNDNEIKKYAGMIKYGCDHAKISGIVEVDGVDISVAREIYKDSTILFTADGESEEELGNVDIDIVNDLSRDMFKNIFAIDYKGMTSISSNAWEEIITSLKHVDDAPNQRSISETINSLSDESSELWRLDNFSGQKIRDLVKERAILNESWQVSRQQQKQMIEDDIKLDNIKKEIQELTNEIELENLFIKEAGKMNELRSNIVQIEELSAIRQGFDKYERWMPDIDKKYSILKDRIANSQEQINHITNSNAKWKSHSQIDELHSEMLDIADEIKALDTGADEGKSINAPNSEIRDEFEHVLELYMEENYDRELMYEALKKIDKNTVSQRIDDYIKANEKKNNIKYQISLDKQNDKKSAGKLIILIASILLGLIGIASFMIKLIAEILPVFNKIIDLISVIPYSQYVIGSIFVLAGLLLVQLSSIARHKNKEKQIMLKEEEIKSIELTMDAIRNDVAKRLCSLPINQNRLFRPDVKLKAIINNLKSVFDEMMAHAEDEPETVFESKNSDRLNELAGIYLDKQGDSDKENISLLKQMLKEAETMSYKQAEAEEIIEANKKLENEVYGQLIAAKDEIEEFEKVLGDKPLETVKYIEKVNNDLAQALSKRDELTQTIGNFNNANQRLAAMNLNGWPYSDDAVNESRARIIQKRERQDYLHTQTGAIKNELDRLSSLKIPQEINNAMIKLDDELDELKLHRDKLVIAQSVLEKGAKNFSTLNQPQVLKTAGKHISMLTNFRYDKIELNQDSSALLIRDMDSNIYDSSKSRLSQATREQIYIALRIALIESFAQDGISFPIFMDEALITWDNDRLKSGILLFKDLNRQLLIFTCHDWLRDMICEISDAKVVELTV